MSSYVSSSDYTFNFFNVDAGRFSMQIEYVARYYAVCENEIVNCGIEFGYEEGRKTKHKNDGVKENDYGYNVM